MRRRDDGHPTIHQEDGGATTRRCDDATTVIPPSIKKMAVRRHSATPSQRRTVAASHHRWSLSVRGGTIRGAGRLQRATRLAGYAERPYSLHPYQYAYSNPVVWTDASGRFVECDVVINDQNPSDWRVECRFWTWDEWKDIGKQMMCPSLPHLSAPKKPIDIGYEGSVASVYVGGGINGGFEEVYDLYDFEYGVFTYSGGGLYTGLGFDVTGYSGVVFGWSLFSQDPGVHNYSGPSVNFSVSGGLPFKIAAATVQGFIGPAVSQPDGTERNMWGIVVGGSLGINPPNASPVNISGGAALFTLQSKESFHVQGTKNLTAAVQFIAFILSRPSASNHSKSGRNFAIAMLLHNGAAWEQTEK